jgi:osmoprotectant transport system permease protein
MGIIGDTIAWLFDPANLTGEGLTPSGPIPRRVVEHVLVSVQALGLAFLIAFPIGLYVGHRRRFEFVAVTAGNLGRAIPSFGILAVAYILTFDLPGELGYWAIFIALLFLSIPPILTTPYVGVKGVDPDTVEAARGMGLSGRQILGRLELPLAVPLVIAGTRTAAVQVVATATLGAVAWDGGLGRYIMDGLAVRDMTRILAGAVLVALLAILTEVGFGALGRVLAPRTSSSRDRSLRRGSAGLPSGEPADHVTV